MTNTNNQEVDMMTQKMNYFFTKQDEFGYTSIWSMYDEVDNIEDKHDLGDDVKYVDYEDYSVEVTGNTWKDLWEAAEKLIVKSGDFHHIFIELFNATDDSEIVRLVTGS